MESIHRSYDTELTTKRSTREEAASMRSILISNNNIISVIRQMHLLTLMRSKI